MLIGAWSRPQPPLPGELLTSCLARNARANGTSPYRFLALFWQDDPVWERDFDRDPGALSRPARGAGAPNWPEDIAKHLGVSREVVEEATLEGWRKRLAGPRRLGGDTPLVLSAGIHHRERTRHALMFCPDCLAAGIPHFRKEWRLAFVVACPLHGRLLADGCGHCGSPLAPHRSSIGGLTGCHRCGRSIAGNGTEAGSQAVNLVSTLQEGLMATLRDEPGGVPGPWEGRAVFDVVRCLVAVSTAGPVRARLQEALAPATIPARGDARLRFEQCRLSVRAPWMELVAAWMADWPRAFRQGADAAGLTGRTFARGVMPRPLAEEVRRLPEGQRRDRTWAPALEEPILKRLRRTDKEAYHRLRATRILDAIGPRQ